jgi:hypothetical protein
VERRKSSEEAEGEEEMKLENLRIGDLIAEYKLNGYVETGLQYGFSLLYAASHEQFQKLVSIEIDPNSVQTFKETYGELSKVSLLHGWSSEKIPEAIEIVEGLTVLWWLDAHKPRKKVAGRVEHEKNYPLESELELLVSNRDCSRDVFLMDDIHWYDKEDKPSGSSEFIQRLLGDTHILSGRGSDGTVRANGSVLGAMPIGGVRG